MTPRGKMPKLGSSVFAAAIAFSIGLLRRNAWRLRRRDGCNRIQRRFHSGLRPRVNRPPATFFTINAVLAKLDRQRGRGPGAMRLASLDAVQCRDRCRACPEGGAGQSATSHSGFLPSARRREYCGASGGALKPTSPRNMPCWIIAGNDAEGCPSYAAQFLRLINAVKAKSGRDQLDEANRAVNMAIRYVSDYRPAWRSRPVERTACHLCNRERRLRGLCDCQICRPHRSRLPAR